MLCTLEAILLSEVITSVGQTGPCLIPFSVVWRGSGSETIAHSAVIGEQDRAGGEDDVECAWL